MPNELYEARQKLAGANAAADGPKLCRLHSAPCCVPCARIALAAQTAVDTPKPIARLQHWEEIRKW